MAVNYNADLRSRRMDEVIDEIDGGAGDAKIQIGTNAMTGASPPATSILVEIELEDPSFTESGGVITMAGVPLSGQADETGIASVARIIDGDGDVVVWGLSVGTTGTEITLNSTSISAGQTVTLSSGTITHSNNAATP